MKKFLKNIKRYLKKLNFGHWAILLSIIGIIILYIISIQSKPKEISISEIEKYNGKYVIVQGVVIDDYSTRSSGKILTIREGNSTLLVYIEKSSKNIEIGDKISVEGKVQKYQDEFEIVVLSDKSIEIIKHWKSNKISIKQLSKSPENYKDVNINISGYAIYVSTYENNTSFYLTDSLEMGNNSLKVICNSNNSTVQNFTEGDFVYVNGKFEFDEFSLRYVVKVEEKEHGVYINFK